MITLTLAGDDQGLKSSCLVETYSTLAEGFRIVVVFKYGGILAGIPFSCL